MSSGSQYRRQWRSIAQVIRGRDFLLLRRARVRQLNEGHVKRNAKVLQGAPRLAVSAGANIRESVQCRARHGSPVSWHESSHKEHLVLLTIRPRTTPW